MDKRRESTSARKVNAKPNASKNNVRVPAEKKKENSSLWYRIGPKLKILAAFILVAVVFIVCMVINISIGVRRIELEGNVLCTREEILGAAGLEEGGGYFSYNTSKAEKKVLERFYCVEKINISRSVFGKVSVKVEETKANWYVESYGEYFALSDDLIVIKNDEKRDRYISAGLVRLTFPEIKSAVLGKKLEMKDADRDTSYVEKLLSDVEKTEIYLSGRLFEIKIKTKFEVFMVVDRRHLVSIGNCNDIEGKLNALIRTLSDSHFDGDALWEINVSEPGSPTAREDNTLDFSYLYPTASSGK